MLFYFGLATVAALFALGVWVGDQFAYAKAYDAPTAMGALGWFLGISILLIGITCLALWSYWPGFLAVILTYFLVNGLRIRSVLNRI